MEAWSSTCPSCDVGHMYREKPLATPNLRAPPAPPGSEVMEDWSKGQWMELVPSGVEEGQRGLQRPPSQGVEGPWAWDPAC